MAFICRLLLEELANQTVKAECVSRVVRSRCIHVQRAHSEATACVHCADVFSPHSTDRQAKLYDQYMNFLCLDARLFSLAQPRTYLQLNDPSATEQEIESTIAEVVNGLFSVLVTLGVVPIIRSPKGGAAQMVASQLDARIRDHLVRAVFGLDAVVQDRPVHQAPLQTRRQLIGSSLALAQISRSNLFSEGTMPGAGPISRPVLCIFDRNFELARWMKSPTSLTCVAVVSSDGVWAFGSPSSPPFAYRRARSSTCGPTSPWSATSSPCA